MRGTKHTPAMQEHGRSPSPAAGGFLTVTSSPLGSNCYLLRSPSGAVVIDTGHPRSDRQTVEALVDRAGPSGIRAVILTHAHADHAGGAGLLQQQTGCEIWAVPAPDHPTLSYQEQQLALVPRPYRITRVLHDNEIIDLGSDRLRVVATPGHTDEHLALYLENNRTLFCGDLFGFEDVGTLDITRSHRQSLQSLLRSCERCRELQPAEVCPGHGGRIRSPSKLFATIEKRALLFRREPLMLLAHTLMPLLLLLIESRGRMTLDGLKAYVVRHTHLFQDFLDDVSEELMAQELGKMLIILELKGLIQTSNGEIMLRHDALHQHI